MAIANSLPSLGSGDVLRTLAQTNGFSQTWASGIIHTVTSASVTTEAEISAVRYWVTLGWTFDNQTTAQDIYNQYVAQGQLPLYIEAWFRDDTVLGTGYINVCFLVIYVPAGTIAPTVRSPDQGPQFVLLPILLEGILIALIVGSVIFPQVQQRVEDVLSGFSGSLIKGPAGVAFNYWVLGAAILGGLGLVYFIAQTKVAKHEGVAVGAFSPSVPALPSPPTVSGESTLGAPGGAFSARGGVSYGGSGAAAASAGRRSHHKPKAEGGTG